MYVLSDPKTKFYLSDGRKLEADEQIALTAEQVLAFKGLFTKVGEAEAEAEDGASAPTSAPAQEPAKVESKAPATSTTPSK